jgi:type I restriction enzyme M protein
MESQVLIDYISGQQISAKPEEIDATQPLLRLLTENGWLTDCIRSRPQWRVPKTPSDADKRERHQSFKGYPCDIALFTSPNHVPKDILLICECKRPDIGSGLEELKILLNHETNAKIGIWFNGDRHAIVYRDGKGGYTIDDTIPIPGPSDSLDFLSPRRILTYNTLVPPPSLKILFEDIRDRVAGQDTQENRDELILTDIGTLLLCKLFDEKQNSETPKGSLDFHTYTSATATATHIRKFAAHLAVHYPTLFPSGASNFSIDDESIQYIVEKLQPYRLLKHDRQSVGDAFQVFRGKVLKGPEGQYFTPGPVVAAAIRILRPTPRERIIDPACGTGGFVSCALDYVYSMLEDKHGQNAGESKKEWAQNNLYAIDKDRVSVRFCKAYLSLLDNGAHIYQGDSLRKTKWKVTWPYLDAEVKQGSFEIVVTNPPFGKKLQVSSLDGREEEYEFSKVWKEGEGGIYAPIDDWEDRQIGIVFLERCLQLLKTNGRMAIVLPETFLFSSTFAWLVDHLCRNYEITHVVNLPMETFEEFCRAKTCLVFLRKTKSSPGHEITMSLPESIGFDKHGTPRDGLHANELMEAVEVITSSSVARRPAESRLMFRVPQRVAHDQRNLVPQYHWRSPTRKAFETFCKDNDCHAISLGDLADSGIIEVLQGHGSPNGRHHGTGPVPYIKVSDVKNWRVIENPSYCISETEARRLWSGTESGLAPYDIITPSRASRNIGMWAVILPHQTKIVLTQEFLRFRIHHDRLPSSLKGLDYAFLLAVMSLAVVRDQYDPLVHMQTNREDLGERWREVVLPIPNSVRDIEKWGAPVRKYFQPLIDNAADILKIRQFLGPMADWPV